jgi:tetratricopeptide (TPR) repeat protein
MNSTPIDLNTVDPVWKNHIQQGNRQIQAQLYDDAIACYEQALSIAEKILQQATSDLNNFEAIHLYVLSCQNLANCHLVLGQLTEAETCLLKAKSSASDIMGACQLPMELRTQAYCAFYATFKDLVKFYEALGDQDALSEIITQSQEQALSFLQQVEATLPSN